MFDFDAEAIIAGRRNRRGVLKIGEVGGKRAVRKLRERKTIGLRAKGDANAAEPFDMKDIASCEVLRTASGLKE